MGLGAGVVPAVTVLFFLLRERALLDAIGGPVIAILSLCFSAGVLHAAVGAWRGRSAARYELVVMAVIYYAHYAWVNLTAATGGLVSPDRVPVHTGRGLRGIVLAVVVVWYFLANPNARKFYAAHAPPDGDASVAPASPRQ